MPGLERRGMERKVKAPALPRRQLAACGTQPIEQKRCCRFFGLYFKGLSGVGLWTVCSCLFNSTGVD